MTDTVDLARVRDDDLVKRLRALRVDGLKFSDTFSDTIGSAKIERCDYTPAVCMDAADHIEAQAAEIKALKEEGHRTFKIAVGWQDRAQSAEAKRDALKAALQVAREYVEDAYDHMEETDAEDGTIQRDLALIDAALTRPAEKEPDNG